MAARPSAYARQIRHEIEKTPEEYLPTLLQIIRLYRQSVLLNPADDSFRQGMSEALGGDVRPIRGLWDGIDAE